jgi:molecular chaperone GrpE
MMNEQEPEMEFSEVGSEVTEVEDVELLRQALAEEKAKAETNLAGWQRTQADFINYKKRSEREKADLGKYANSELMLKLLPALDDLERALAAIPPRQSKLSWVEGVRLIERKLRTILEGEGLSQIEALGEPFDPHFHEAVMQGKGEEGTVVEEIQKGYRLHDRVIRPSRVVVGSGKEDEQGGEE